MKVYLMKSGGVICEPFHPERMAEVERDLTIPSPPTELNLESLHERILFLRNLRTKVVERPHAKPRKRASMEAVIRMRLGQDVTSKLDEFFGEIMEEIEEEES